MTKSVAGELAKQQRSVSVSEFFTKNRHLLGFDNPIRALQMAIKEAVDNSLDAVNEMRILPEIYVEIIQVSEKRFKIVVEDNGPGIIKAQIPDVFGRLLYGSKFHRFRQSRGSQGIGISASVLYAQLTTGKPAKIISKTGKKEPAHYYELNIDTKTNEPQISKEEEIKWDEDHGTKVELELEGKYQKGKQSVDEFLKQVAIVNPEAHITYINPLKEKIEYPAATKELPAEAKEIKPHPHGIELGMLIQMMNETKARTVQSFLTTDFSRIGAGTAKKMCDAANVKCNARPTRIAKQEAENLFNAMQSAKVIAPPTNCLSPITADVLEKGLKKEVDADFFSTVTRPPTVYRGFPFNVEIGIAHGGNLEADNSVRLLRFANRVPLLYQQGACAITKSIGEINWRPYGLQQSGKNLPRGPALILVHIASVWVPFTSEAKDAIAHYPEIIKEIKLAAQECGRKLASHIRKTVRVKEQKERASLFEKYIPEVSSSLSSLTGEKKKILEAKLYKILKKSLKELFNQEKNDKEKQTTLGS